MSEAATMVHGMTSFAPATGATMGAVKGERVLFVPKTTLIAGMLAVTMVSPPVFASTRWTSAQGGETVNRDLALADGTVMEPDDIDLDALDFQAEVLPLSAGFRLAEVPSPFPPADPDLLTLEE